MSKLYWFVYFDLDEKGNGSMDHTPNDSFFWYQKVISSNGENLG
nr:hypothetical protein [Limosilactobacillus mucosae]